MGGLGLLWTLSQQILFLSDAPLLTHKISLEKIRQYSTEIDRWGGIDRRWVFYAAEERLKR